MLQINWSTQQLNYDINSEQVTIYDVDVKYTSIKNNLVVLVHYLNVAKIFDFEANFDK